MQPSHPHEGPQSISGSPSLHCASQRSAPQSSSAAAHTDASVEHVIEHVPLTLHVTSTPAHADDPLHSTLHA